MKHLQPLMPWHNAYERDENDEFVAATCIIGEDGQPVGLIRDNDAV